MAILPLILKFSTHSLASFSPSNIANNLALFVECCFSLLRTVATNFVCVEPLSAQVSNDNVLSGKLSMYLNSFTSFREFVVCEITFSKLVIRRNVTLFLFALSKYPVSYSKLQFFAECS